MSQQKAEAMGARLTRIWAPGVVDYWHVVDAKFRAEFSFGELSVVHLQNLDNPYYWIQLSGEEAGLRWGAPSSSQNRIHLLRIEGDKTTFEETPAVRAFAMQWLPLFRRNIWLVGGDIECSAHEKAEWMQGFTTEEIEASNLKL